MTPEPMTDAQIASLLSNVQKDVREYITELNALPKGELPSDYDAVCLAEFTDRLAQTCAPCPSVACFLGSFWESHHMLAEHIPYETAVRSWFNWADDCLTNEIESRTE